ncbi:uncharacterized protein HMPREF1541_10175 [Cyphellophora europaea CBS 101466]|uniref:CHAT domain-containing protein n=1 Tax=Cyphellophora europaea (strain CBS 101466) TaxID=1220924 RepID=W2S7A6_CYPE1|nr:uncharacterized protein HMPREF1541_10175 [Cyphellophora europaea CBS 101466]ETN44505.1 hypothetical protein HMPREF1541_10175 [Cyphellophora europaea CBS 101466]
MSAHVPQLTLLVQAKSVEVDEAACPAWRVDISLDGLIISKDIIFWDPLTASQSSELRWYLERYATTATLERARAYNASRIVSGYGALLFEALLLFRVSSRINKIARAPAAWLNIDVRELMDAQSITPATFHRIHWESLEVSELWKVPGLTIAVRRVVDQASLPVQTRIRTLAAPVLNVLLVVARRTDYDSTSRRDIDPSIASRNLEVVQNILERTKAPYRLNLEIVRPGTFSAFERHVKSRQVGFFHLVHFDLHGKIGMRQGVKVAFLEFAAANRPGQLSAVSAQNVARVLIEANIQAVCLNACESGRANAGQDANLAKILVAKGVQNVLAMSYKLLASGAEILLQSFYKHLLVHGEPFDVAASYCRASMRHHTARNARFGHEVLIYDWVVPVIYCHRSAKGSQPWQVGSCVGTRSQIPMSPAAAKVTSSSSAIVGPEDESIFSRLTGRAFDSLRFEQVSLTSKIVALSGPAGIGKTTFLRSILRFWERTNYIGSYDFMNTDMLSGFEDSRFLSYIIGALLPADTMDSDAALSALQDPATRFENWVHDHIMRNISSKRRVLVFDQLDLMYSEFSYWGGWSKRKRSLFELLLNAFNTYPQAAGSPPKVTIILVLRRSDPVWLARHFSSLLNIDKFELPRLSFTDSEEYVTTILSVPLQVSGCRSHSESEALGNIIGLSTGNPLFLQHVFTLYLADTAPKRAWLPFFPEKYFGASPRRSKSLQQYSSSLHFHVVPKLAQGASIRPRFLYELEAIITGAPEIMVAIWALLSLYWHTGPRLSQLATSVQRLTLDGDDAGIARNLVDSLVVAQDRGFLLLDDVTLAMGVLAFVGDARVAWIHPLFTITMRAMLFSTALMSPSHRYFNHLDSIRWILGAYSPPTSSGNFSKALVMEFLESIHDRSYETILEDRKGNVSSETTDASLRPMLYNMFSAMQICASQKPLVPVHLWPIYQLIVASPHLSLALSSGERSMSLRLYEQILYRFLDHNDDYAIPHHYQPLLMFICGSLVSFLQPGPYLPTAKAEKVGRLVKMALQASEDAFGPMSGLLLIRMKAVLYANEGRLLIAKGEEQEAKRAELRAFSLWKESLAIETQRTEADELGLDTRPRRWSAEEAEVRGFVTEDLLDRYRYLKAARTILEQGPNIPIRMAYSPGLRDWQPSQALIAWAMNQSEGREPMTPEGVKDALMAVATREWEISTAGAAISNMDPFVLEETPRRYVSVKLDNFELQLKLRLLDEAMDIDDWLRAANLYYDFALRQAVMEEGDSQNYWACIADMCRLYEGEDEQQQYIVELSEIADWHNKRLRLPYLFDEINDTLRNHTANEALKAMLETLEIFQSMGLDWRFVTRATLSIERFKEHLDTHFEQKKGPEGFPLLSAYDSVVDEYTMREPGSHMMAKVLKDYKNDQASVSPSTSGLRLVDALTHERLCWLENFASTDISGGQSRSHNTPRGRLMLRKAWKQAMNEIGAPFDALSIPDSEHELADKYDHLLESLIQESSQPIIVAESLERAGYFEAAAQALQLLQPRGFTITSVFWRRREELELKWCNSLCERILEQESRGDFDGAGRETESLAATYDRGCFAHLETMAVGEIEAIIECFRCRVKHARSRDWSSAAKEVDHMSDILKTTSSLRLSLKAKALYELKRAFDARGT